MQSCQLQKNGIAGKDVPLLSKISQLDGVTQTEAQSLKPDA
jgi:hypothetical protein